MRGSATTVKMGLLTTIATATDHKPAPTVSAVSSCPSGGLNDLRLRFRAVRPARLCSCRGGGSCADHVRTSTGASVGGPSGPSLTVSLGEEAMKWLTRQCCSARSRLSALSCGRSRSYRSVAAGVASSSPWRCTTFHTPSSRR